MICSKNEINIQVDQGDVYRYIQFYKSVEMLDEEMEVEECKFDYALVLSQSCDLHREQEKIDVKNEILSVLVVPLFRLEEFKKGTHLSNIGKTCEETSKKLIERYSKWEHERYHIIDIDEKNKLKYEISDSFVIDFRYFFTADISQFSKDNYICSLESLYREKVTQRFSNYLARIGLPVSEAE